MKRSLKGFFALSVTASLLLGSLNVMAVDAASAISVTSANAWFESAVVDWEDYSGADSYNAYYKLAGESDFIKVDNELVLGSYLHLPGLKADNEYQIKIVASASGSEIDSSEAIVSVTPKAYLREGFAFSKGVTTGGYNQDGTVPENATIIYVTEDSKNTVTSTLVYNASKNQTATCTGVSGALLCRQKSGSGTEPVIIRVIGKVTAPTSGSYAVNDSGTSSSDDGVDSAGLLNIKKTKNITIEGIGPDAQISGWGFNVRECSNIEIRNLTLGEQEDDSISIQVDNDHIWVHNNQFNIGANGGGDKTKGDGSCDLKDDSTYVTIDSNLFNNTGKSSLCGMKSESTGVGFVTYHHNWYHTSGSRHPRVRTITTHVYNNYYDHCYSGGIAACMGSSVFVDSNYFEDCVRPMFAAGQGNDIKSDGKSFSSGEDGGVIKAYGNKIATCESGSVTYLNEDLEEVTKACTGCTYYNGLSKTMEPIVSRTDFTKGSVAAGNYPEGYDASARDEQVPSGFAAYAGGATYNNFDTNAEIMSDYVSNVQSADEAKAYVMANAGTLPEVFADNDEITTTTETTTESTTELTTESTTESTSETTTETVTETETETTTETVTETETETTTEITTVDILLGDANASYTLEASDAAEVLQKVLNSDYSMPIENKTSEWMKYIAVAGADELSATDGAFILQKVLNGDYRFPVLSND